MGLPTDRETNPASDRVAALNPGPSNCNTSALNNSATLPPQIPPPTLPPQILT